MITTKVKYTEPIKLLLSNCAEKWRRYCRHKTDRNYSEYTKAIEELSKETGLSLMQSMELVANYSRHSRKRNK